MSTGNPQSVQKLRRWFRYLNPLVLLNWRLGLGPWLSLCPQWGGRYMVIAHRGRKSGKRRLTPLNYTEIEGEVYCVAGFGGIADWYRNLMANPQVEVWLPDGRWVGVAQDASDDSRRLVILRRVLRDSGFAGRLAGFHPQMSDEALQALTADYRLVHIRRAAACTGAGGPGDLVWLWPVTTLGLLLALLWRPRRK